ncbi:MAG: hypothetical protein LBV79_11120 [Candidatus Adiutrix sp.]|jgi:hypothetical protein|nr:hypothetical protein [Candidatus Adiutrix sp.]
MGFASFILLAIGVPLALLAVGFIILVTKVFGDGDGRAERAQTLETARRLEVALSSLETRLGALEDIILSAGDTKKRDNDYER